MRNWNWAELEKLLSIYTSYLQSIPPSSWIFILLAKTIPWYTEEKLTKNKNYGSTRMIPYSKRNVCKVEPIAKI